MITEYLHQTEESRHESAVRRQEYLDNIMTKYVYDVLEIREHGGL